MSTPRSQLARVLAAGLLLAGCASAPSPSPSPSPSMAPVPTASAPSATRSPAPSPGALGPVQQIAAGAGHTCALIDGGVKCWGSNEFGELGDGSTTASSLPVGVVGLDSGVRSIAAGGRHTCVVTAAGAARCWGSNGAGQLGNGTTSDSNVPVDVTGLEAGVASIAVGGGHTCALSTAGAVSCWGYNEYGQLGTGSQADSLVPVAVTGLAAGISTIIAADIHSCALTSGGVVKCWGYRPSGGVGGAVPEDVPGLDPGVTLIAGGYEHTCALKSGGDVTCWGGFEFAAPVDVPGLGGGNLAISVQFSGRSCALGGDGSVKCWSGEDQPIAVAGLRGSVVALAGGGSHTCALMAEERVMCWGDNWFGQLGDGRPCGTWAGSGNAVDVQLAGAGSEPTPAPAGRIDYASGPTDVVLRYNVGPDIGVGELEGEMFQPGPEFTLYGDGTAIFRDHQAEPSQEGSVLRARPFRIAHLDDEAVQSLLRFALWEEDLAGACAVYPTQDTDVVSFDVLTVRAGDVNKRVESFGSDPFGVLTERLRNFDRSGIPSTIWVPDRYWVNLIDAAIFANIGDGVPPGLADSGSVAWPWPGLTPASFDGLPDSSMGRRAMSADEAAALDLAGGGGVVQRIYVRGPDGTTLFYVSLWPMALDEG